MISGDERTVDAPDLLFARVMMCDGMFCKLIRLPFDGEAGFASRYL